MSKILCIIDGMTDAGFRRSYYPSLSGMNLIRHIDTTCRQKPESLGCILRILGTKKVPSNLRGYAEALGNGIPVNHNDLVLRGSWFALDENGRCTVPTTAPDSLPDACGCRYYAFGQYKSLLVFPGMAASAFKLLTFPPYACSGQTARQLCPRGCTAVENLFYSQLTEKRCLILWGQSVPIKLAPFPQRAAVVCGASIVKGISRLLNMELIPVPGATGDTDTDLSAKVSAALQAAEAYPFVLLHINGADEAAHRKSAEEKQAFLKKVDETVIPALLRSGHTVYITADHGTDPVHGTHVGGLQPVFSNAADIENTPVAEEASNVPNADSMTAEQWKVWAIRQLQDKAKEKGGTPTKADFEAVEKIRIKAALGPWPRALEAAGLKEPKEKKTNARRR